MISKIISHHFPSLNDELQLVADTRIAPQYTIEEIIFGGIAMFLFKSGSRNQMNNLGNENKFRKNFLKTFKFRLPQQDTVKTVFEKLNPKELEDLKTTFIKQLIENKIFDKWRLNGKIVIAIDGTGILTFKERHCDKCLVRNYKVNENRKTEKKVYFHNVLEAKIITPNGFSISICTEWIENDDTVYDKQDCEQKAFGRIAIKLKENFPRLPILLCADGLYPNNTFFEICKKNQWDYIVTLPDKTLKGFWNKIRLVNRQFQKNEYKEDNLTINQKFEFINQTEHNGYVHNWIETNETQTNKTGKSENSKFVHITNLEINHDNVISISNTGRMRWKIEKQGFDQQKNHGYNISHKFCRKSYTGTKNYYQCCQIAHLFNQLVELTKDVEKLISKKVTIKHLWICLFGFMIYGDVSEEIINETNNHRTQFQYIK